MAQFILYSIIVFLVTILALVAILLFAKRYLTPSGKVTITLNGKEKISVDQGASLLSTLSENGVYLSSACGGKGSCGQCKCQVPEGGGEILDVEKGHFTRKQIKEHYRLGCQCKVKGDLSVTVPESVLGVKGFRRSTRRRLPPHIRAQSYDITMLQQLRTVPIPGKADTADDCKSRIEQEPAGVRQR